MQPKLQVAKILLIVLITFFVNIGPTLADDIPISNDTFSTYLTNSLRNFWHPFSRSVRNYFVDARTNHGCGYKNWHISVTMARHNIYYSHHWICE